MQEAIERGYSFPWAWYTDPAVCAIERERIFRRSWQYVGHAEQVAGPGDFVACRAGDVPVVVVRDEGGELNAFLNVCRHRGFEVVQGHGCRKTLQCPYHAWTYGLDGTLRNAPRSEREPEFERSELSLLPVRVETWGPFVFVNPDQDAAPLEETLGAVPELVASAGIDVGALRFRFRSESELASNWKIVVENFLECYHCPVAHPSFSAFFDVSPDAYRLEMGETFSVQVAPVRERWESSYDPTGQIERGHFYFLWPNLALNIVPGRPNLSIGPVLPVSADRTERFLDYFFGEEADDAWVDDLVAFDNQVGAEDQVLVEGVQRSVRSGMIERGRLLPSSERLIEHFQGLVIRALED